MTMRAWVCCALALAGQAAAVLAGDAYVMESRGRFVLGNGQIALTLDRSGGQVRLSSEMGLLSPRTKYSSGPRATGSSNPQCAVGPTGWV